MQKSIRTNWNVRFEVTFYGNDPNKGSFRKIKKDNIVFNDEFEIENKLAPANSSITVIIYIGLLLTQIIFLYFYS